MKAGADAWTLSLALLCVSLFADQESSAQETLNIDKLCGPYCTYAALKYEDVRVSLEDVVLNVVPGTGDPSFAEIGNYSTTALDTVDNIVNSLMAEGDWKPLFVLPEAWSQWRVQDRVAVQHSWSLVLDYC